MLKTDAKSKMVKNERKRKSENDEIHIDSSCIINRRFLRYTKGYPWNQKVSSQPPRSHSIAYPKVSMYYAFNEDTDPFTRVPISCKSLFNDEDVHFVPPKKPFTERDVYSEAEARNEYLRRKPTCFVVFGKPGLGGCKLSKLIADAWQCVLVSPMTVIQEEINKQSRIGNCMLKILQQGRTISPNIILKLMESRIRKRDAVYKGYIVEGLPLIPNNADLDYSSYPDYNPENELQDDDTSTSTSSTSFFNESGDIKINYSSSVFNINVESLFLDDDNNTSDLFRNTLDAAVQPTIAKQINNIFTEWPVKPTIIIYIMSPDKDVIRKREQTRFNIETGETVNRSISDLKSNSQIFQTQEAAETSFSWMMVENYNLFQDNDSKYLLKRIIDLSRNVESQCAIYEEFAIPVIDQWVLDHKPENVIRVDGRTSVMQMFEIISTRLRILPLTRLILPVKLFKDQSTSNEEEEDMEELVENKFGSKHVDEVFKELKNTDALSLRFPWVLSKWKHFCPVELAKGTLMSGVPKYAVRYMDKLYFLATLENVGLFLENPKTFLLPPNPKVPCRIAIFGPKLSGKTKICNQLADFFDAALIDVCQVEKKYVDECMKLKVNNTLLDITDDVIEELRVRLNNERSDRETRRLRELEEWFKEIKFAFQNFINIQNPTEGEGEDSTNSDHDMRRTYRKLEENDVPFLVTDLALQEQILANPQLLYNYAPKELRNEEEPVRDLTKNDPEVVEILKERVKYLDEQPIELNVEEKANMIAEIIISLPQKQIDENLFRDADFVIDNMYMDADVWTKLVEELDIAFENVIIIFEDSPYKNLLNKYSYLIDVDDEEVESLDNLSTDSDEEESSKYVENIEYITNFNYKRKVLEEKVEASGVSVIACDLSRDEATLENIVNIMSDPLKEKARILTDEEREEMELVEIEAIEISTEREKENDEGEEEVADEGEENENYDTKKMEERDNINLGDTNHYCPIALLKHHVLLKGNKDFSVFYNNKIYLLSNENALNDLIKDPAALGLPLKEPLATIPPLRVSIIGPIGCGKSSLSSNLSKHYGLMNIKYLNNFTKFMDDRQMSSFTYHKSIIFPEELPVTINLPENLDSEMYNIDKATIQTFILQYWKNGGYLPKNMLEECLLKFFKYPYNECGAVFDGFPSCIEDVDTMQKNYTVPEIIIELSCDITEASERIVAALLKSWMKEMEIKKTIEEDRYQEEMENYINKREIWIKEEIKKLSMLNQEEE
ncbi:adenylate kinase 9-like, partial [Prorops nasuta]|uniref:adenylate kinase 9-like n=1 Tax=Prorops nasuta TaxID=863751 RepID=UPI0034CEB207